MQRVDVPSENTGIEEKLSDQTSAKSTPFYFFSMEIMFGHVCAIVGKIVAFPECLSWL